MGATTTATFHIYFCRFSGVLVGLCRATKSEPFSVIGGGLSVGKSVPIQLAQCLFPGLTISNVKI